MTFIQHFLTASVPHRLESGWTVEITAHYLGGGRHYAEFEGWPRRWEIADIGLLVQFREGGRLVRSKVALLQSKRLYPNEQELDELTPVDYMYGFARLYDSDNDWAAVTAPRQFGFTAKSRYRALLIGDRQYRVIASYEAQRSIPVYYMLYNPLQIPFTVQIPLTAAPPAAGTCEVGCRVVPAARLRNALMDQTDGHSPAYGELLQSLGNPFTQDMHPAGWRLEHFVADLLIECETGYLAESRADRGLDYIFNRRSGPISAAISITIDAPS